MYIYIYICIYIYYIILYYIRENQCKTSTGQIILSMTPYELSSTNRPTLDMKLHYAVYLYCILLFYRILYNGYIET